MKVVKLYKGISLAKGQFLPPRCRICGERDKEKLVKNKSTNSGYANLCCECNSGICKLEDKQARKTSRIAREIDARRLDYLHVRAKKPEVIKEKNARVKKRYHEDPEYKEQVKKNNDKYRKTPEYRAKNAAYNRNRRKLLKEKKHEETV